MKKEIRIFGGGMLRPLIAWGIVVLILMVAVIVKQMAMKEQNIDKIESVTLILCGILLWVVWLILIRNGKLHILIIKGDCMKYINWYGKEKSCNKEDIEKIERAGAYICLWDKKKGLFAKFNRFTKGLEDLQNLSERDVI